MCCGQAGGCSERLSALIQAQGDWEVWALQLSAGPIRHRKCLCKCSKDWLKKATSSNESTPLLHKYCSNNDWFKPLLLRYSRLGWYKWQWCVEIISCATNKPAARGANTQAKEFSQWTCGALHLVQDLIDLELISHWFAAFEWVIIIHWNKSFPLSTAQHHRGPPQCNWELIRPLSDSNPSFGPHFEP